MNQQAPKPIEDEKVVYEGRIFEVVTQKHQVGDIVADFEKVRRAPGVRLLIVRDEKILLTKEYRSELGGYDFRLPGGKVFDTLDEYREALKSDVDLLGEAKKAAEREALEEVGHVINNIKHIHTTAPGGTVEWDLYYFLIEDSDDHEDGQQLDVGEVIEPVWKTMDEVRDMCKKGEIQEDRTVAVLARYLAGAF